MADQTSPPNDPQSGQHKVDPKLLEILVCPVTKSPLRYDADRQELVSEQAGLAYPIRDGIPIMLPDEARALDDTP
ncbi:MAG: Trm112 family protein [Pseudomonadota bacterium]